MSAQSPLMKPGKRKKTSIEVDSSNLSTKESSFLTAYIANGGNGKAAAISAGYSEKTAKQIACNILRKENVSKEKDRLMSKLADEAGLTAIHIFKKLKMCTELDPEENGPLVIKALELAGKHHGLFTEKSEVTLKSHENWLEDIKEE